MLRSGTGLAQQGRDPSQGDGCLRPHPRVILSLLVGAGLAGEHDPTPRTIRHDAVREAARPWPTRWLQCLH